LVNLSYNRGLWENYCGYRHMLWIQMVPYNSFLLCFFFIFDQFFSSITNFILTLNPNLVFFYWFELYYASKNHIAYLFTKYACPIKIRNKTRVWKLANSTLIESKYSLLRNLKVSYKNQIIETAPYKPLNKDVTTNTKYIIQ